MFGLCLHHVYVWLQVDRAYVSAGAGEASYSGADIVRPVATVYGL